MDTDLAGRVAHSVKNSLAALTGTLEMLLEERPEEPRLVRAVRLAKRVGQVVDRTLRLHRLGELYPEQAAPAAILREVTRELSPRAGSGGIDVRVEIANELPRICVDRPLLVAALSALAENSLEGVFVEHDRRRAFRFTQ